MSLESARPGLYSSHWNMRRARILDLPDPVIDA